MPRLAKTAARGYGGPHQKHLARARRQYQPGQPCPECGQPVEPWQPMHLMHDHVNGGYLGLGHAWCNLRERNKRHARRKRQSGFRTSRAW